MSSKGYGKGYMMYMHGDYFTRRRARLRGRRPIRIIGGGPPRSTRAKASRALRLIRKFQKEEEVKQIDISGTATLNYSLTDTWQTAGRILLNPLSQGTTAEERIGKKMTMKDLTLRFKIIRGTTDARGIVARVVIFYDRKPAGAVPAPTDIFDTDTILSPLQRNNAGRFAILYDNMFNLDTEQFYLMDKVYLKLNRVGKVDYGLGNSGDITDISKGALYVWANYTNIDTSNPSFEYNSRVKYTDA